MSETGGRSPRHVPVLLDRVVALLAPALDHDGAVLVDCTLGLGGHSEAVLERLRSEEHTSELQSH